MAKIEKLIESIRNNPKNVSLKELKRLLDHMGYEQSRTNGSHSVYIKSGRPSITIVEKTPVKKYLVNDVLNILDTIEYDSQD